jgi:hypothetical protein
MMKMSSVKIAMGLGNIDPVLSGEVDWISQVGGSLLPITYTLKGILNI